MNDKVGVVLSTYRKGLTAQIDAYRRTIGSTAGDTALASSPEYHIEHRALTYKKGWPTHSAKPFLVYKDGKFVAAFANRYQAEKRTTRSY